MTDQLCTRMNMRELVLTHTLRGSFPYALFPTAYAGGLNNSAPFGAGVYQSPATPNCLSERYWG